MTLMLEDVGEVITNTLTFFSLPGPLGITLHSMRSKKIIDKVDTIVNIAVDCWK